MDWILEQEEDGGMKGNSSVSRLRNWWIWASLAIRGREQRKGTCCAGFARPLGFLDRGRLGDDVTEQDRPIEHRCTSISTPSSRKCLLYNGYI